MSWTIRADEKSRLNNLIFHRLQILEDHGIDQYHPVWGDQMWKGSELYESGDFKGAERILKTIMKKNKLGDIEQPTIEAQEADFESSTYYMPLLNGAINDATSHSINAELSGEFDPRQSYRALVEALEFTKEKAQKLLDHEHSFSRGDDEQGSSHCTICGIPGDI